jgi:hypothetical protein
VPVYIARRRKYLGSVRRRTADQRHQCEQLLPCIHCPLHSCLGPRASTDPTVNRVSSYPLPLPPDRLCVTLWPQLRSREKIHTLSSITCNPLDPLRPRLLDYHFQLVGLSISYQKSKRIDYRSTLFEFRAGFHLPTFLYPFDRRSRTITLYSIIFKTCLYTYLQAYHSRH